MDSTNDEQLGLLWDEDSIERQAQDDLAKFIHVKKGFTWPIYPEELARALWGTETEFIDLTSEVGAERVLAYFDPKRNIILVNTALNHTDQQAAFSIAHEVGHLALHGFLSDQRGGGHAWCHELHGNGPLERQANQYAAAILMPKVNLVERVNVLAGSNRLDLAVHGDALGTHFGVSRRALEIRLSTLTIPFDNPKYPVRAHIRRVLDDMDDARRDWTISEV